MSPLIASDRSAIRATRRTPRLAASVVAGILLASCAGVMPFSETRSPASGSGPTTPARPGGQPASQELDERLARLHLLLLERDAQLKVLAEKLDAAILEVVRTMAKLRSVESKAEAASTLAEAEIAWKVLQREVARPEREKDPDVAPVEQLLNLGAQEFRKENYGGALYLASQAKTLLKGGQARSMASQSVPRVDGEVLFSVPLPLRVLGKNPLREGPGQSFRALFVVDEGAKVIGQSYKGLWVRVRTEDGRGGWILYNGVGQR